MVSLKQHGNIMATPSREPSFYFWQPVGNMQNQTCFQAVEIGRLTFASPYKKWLPLGGFTGSVLRIIAEPDF